MADSSHRLDVSVVQAVVEIVWGYLSYQVGPVIYPGRGHDGHVALLSFMNDLCDSTPVAGKQAEL